MRFFLIIFYSLLTGVIGFSQEILTGLQINPMVKARILETNRMDYLDPGLDTIPVAIPFFDDFSSSDVFPSSQRWIDHFAFQNNDLAVYPVNLGAMTLDAINDSGNMYPTAVPGPAEFIADHLTSRYIRLDSVLIPVPHALTPADSVYFSFFYQPQGRGKAPQKNDTLILEFLVKAAHDSITTGGVVNIPDKWRQVWFDNGMPLDTFYMRHNKWFQQVLIPLTDTVFFTKKFRFRFYNYVSLASSAEPSWQSNAAQWNLDDVYLNLGRNQYDTVRPELRFIYRPPSLLRRYESMPYPQYCDDPTNEIRDTIDVLMTNRDTISHLSTYNYYVTAPGGGFSKTYSGGEYEIQPYQVNPYVTYQKFAHPEVPFLIPISEADSAIFLMKHVINPVAPGTVKGDTMTGYQKFYNYYAYDDGTPEASYGLTSTGSALAYRFRLNKSPDTLRAVRIYFNRTLSNNSKQFFYLHIWNDNAGKPGDTIYTELVFPRYADSLNKFVTYHLNRALAVTGTFYVGMIQTTPDNLSVGFDRYNNSQDEIFWNSAGVWNNSAFTGSLMIRPVLGKPIPLGISDLISGKMKIVLYPNPCVADILHIRLADQAYNANAADGFTVFIMDMIGHVRVKQAFRQEVDVSSFATGLYFLEVRNHSGYRVAGSKFIVSH